MNPTHYESTSVAWAITNKDQDLVLSEQEVCLPCITSSLG